MPVAILLIFFSLPLSGQEYFRFGADLTLKEISRMADSTEQRLVVGKCTYDKTSDKLTYSLSFPYPEQWIIQDTFIYRIKDQRLIGKSSAPLLSEQNMFKMLLDQTFSEFGMMKSGYHLQGVKRHGHQVFITYLPPAEFSEVLGSIVLIKEKKLLMGVIYYEPDGNLLFRQHLDDYQIIDGLPIPTTLAQVIEKDGKEIKRMVSFSNVVINEPGHDQKYNPAIPGPLVQ